MWTVLIADDEPKIRKRLKRLVESLGKEFQICGEAEDGIEALNRIEEELPDILLVDICMPKLNGLDFIQQISNEVHNSIIIVISGHDEFEYAQRAVQLPIFEYILKPVEASLLDEVLTRAIEVLRERRKKNKLLQWAEHEVSESRDELVQELFSDWIHSYSSPGEITERKRVLSFDFKSPIRMLAIQLNAFCYGITALEIREHKVLTLAVKRLVSDILNTKCRWLSFKDQHDHLIYIIEGSFSEEECESLRLCIRNDLNLPVRCGVSDARLEYDEFVDDYENLCAIIGAPGREGNLIRKIYTFMEKHYCDKDLDLSTAASTLALSPGYISRLLKQHTGYSFSEFTNRFRIFEAIQLLGDDSKLIYEIADEVGYSSQHYFSRIFRRISGLSPVDYRRGSAVG